MSIATVCDALTDVLSDAARDLVTRDYGTAYQRFVVPAGGDPDARSRLKRLTPEQLFRVPPTRADDAAGVLAGLWLWHDWLDESHTVSQGIGSTTGSYWHAIMHRREGDFSNAKYWYAKCRTHPAHAVIAERAAAVVGADEVLQPLLQGGWDAYAFVDAVQSAENGSVTADASTKLRQLQRLEWESLFVFTARDAIR